MNQETRRWLAGLGLLAAGLWILQGFIAALAWAVVIGIATWPLYQSLRAAIPAHFNRRLPAAVFTLLLALVFVAPLVVAVVELGLELHTIVHFVKDAQNQGMTPPDWLVRLPYGSSLVDEWNSRLGSPSAANDTFREVTSSPLFAWTKSIGAHVFHSLVTMAVTLLAVFFIYARGDELIGSLTTLCSNLFGARGGAYLDHATLAVRATVNGLVVVGLGEGLLLGIAYLLCGLPHPTLLGALTGIFAMIPFAAPIIFCAGALILAAKGSLGAALALATFGFVILFIADHFVRPMVIGNGAKLPFLWVLLGIFGGLETGHLIGLFLGPTIMALLIALWREWTQHASASSA